MMIFFAFMCLIFIIVYVLFIHKKKLSKKGRMNRTIFALLFSVFMAFLVAPNSDVIAEKGVSDINESSEEVSEIESTELEEVEVANSVQMDVPLIDQMEYPRLYNGCEVTSLAMLFQYIELDVSKNEIADRLVSVPFQNEDGTYGDPREGFVGDVTGNYGAGYSVYSDPMIQVAEEYLPEGYKVVDLTGEDFDAVIQELANGYPVWCITTVSMAATNDIEIWDTNNGPVEISWNIHSVLITGYDEEQIFVNDPYGEKKATDRKDFIEAWEQMGSQAFTIEKVS